MILLHEPTLGFNEKKNLNSCIDSNWVSPKGKFVELFKKQLRILTKSRYILPVTSGTEALRVSLRVLGANSNCEIVMPSISFIATANAASYNNAHPLFIDVDNEFGIDENKTLDFLKSKCFKKKGHCFNKKTKRKIFAIVIVHPFGNCAKFENIYEFCKKNNIFIIEDAAESVGVKFNYGKFKNMHTGTVGDIGCFSFNGNKIITTGGGGCIITNKKSLYENAYYLCDQAKDNNIKYIHNSIGYNSLMTNLTASVGVAQLKKLKEFINKKKKIYRYYKKNIKVEGINLLNKPEDKGTNYWLNIIKFKKKISEKKILNIINIFNKEKIQVRPIWFPMSYQKMYKNNYSYKLENTKNIYKQYLCIPSSASLSKKKLDKVIKTINKIKI